MKNFESSANHANLNNRLEQDALSSDYINCAGENHENLRPKHATRTVLFDEIGQVAIINVTKHGYYKIPGGGVEDGEDLQTAAKREVLEESGCDCTVGSYLGRIETPVPIWEMYDISDGFIATVVGEKATPQYEDWENARGFQIEWFKDLDAAINTIENNQVQEPGMEALQTRDLNFLKLARAKL